MIYIYLFSIQETSIKIECGNSIDAAFWAHDFKPSHVYVFSGSKYYIWNTLNNTIITEHLTNQTWTNLPASVDAACSFYHNRNLIHIFLKVSLFRSTPNPVIQLDQTVER